MKTIEIKLLGIKTGPKGNVLPYFEWYVDGRYIFFTQIDLLQSDELKRMIGDFAEGAQMTRRGTLIGAEPVPRRSATDPRRGEADLIGHRLTFYGPFRLSEAI